MIKKISSVVRISIPHNVLRLLEVEAKESNMELSELCHKILKEYMKEIKCR